MTAEEQVHRVREILRWGKRDGTPAHELLDKIEYAVSTE